MPLLIRYVVISFRISLGEKIMGLGDAGNNYAK